MFGRHAMRLMRERWSKLGVDALAEEIFVILSNANLDLSHSGPITLTQEGDDPAIRIRSGSPFPNISIERDESVDLEIGSEGIESPSGEATTGVGSTAGSTSVTGTSVFMGTVVSGSEDTYEVELQNGQSVTAIQQQITAGETIPAGTVTPIFLIGGTYMMQAPVWLDDLEE
jgi:hypothetical protein